MTNKEKAEFTYNQIKRMKQAVRNKALKEGLAKEKVVHEYNITRSGRFKYLRGWRNKQ